MNNSIFSVLVIGDNPDEQMMTFDIGQDLEEPYILYKYSEREQLKEKKIKLYEGLLYELDNNKYGDTIRKELEKLKKTSTDAFYLSLSDNYGLDNEMNIITYENPNGKWFSCEKGGKLYSNYLKNKEGEFIVSAKKNQIDWDYVHMNNDKVLKYNRTWEMCVENDKPITESDINIYNNMSSLNKQYFERFGSKEMFINMSCSFHTYAVCNNGLWSDMEFVNEFNWIPNFYKKFVDLIKDDELFTIYECIK